MMNSEKDMHQPMMVSSHDIYTSEPEKLAQGVRDIIQRPVGDFPLPFALVPWGQHIEIITRSESVEEAIFYIHQVKENYDFGFATVDHELYEEKELEDALTENVTNLLLEMGNGFAFMGKQREIRKEMQATRRLMKKNEGRA